MNIGNNVYKDFGGDIFILRAASRMIQKLASQSDFSTMIRSNVDAVMGSHQRIRDPWSWFVGDLSELISVSDVQVVLKEAGKFFNLFIPRFCLV